MSASSQFRRSPLAEAGSNLSFGPGGQITIVSKQDNPQPAVVSQNPIAQDVQSMAAPSQVLQLTASQPLLTSTSPQLEPTISAILGTTNAPPGTSVVKFPSDPSLVSSFSVVSISPSSLSSMSVAITSTSVISSSPLSQISESSAVEINASSTTLASSQSALPSAIATSTGHSPPYYIGIVLGTIIIIACLAALVAWWIRMRSHARRRLADEAAGVPWAKPTTNSSLEDGRETTFIGSGNLSAMGPMDPSSQNPMTWEPRGDRDVGEPKRTDSFLNAPVSPMKRYATPYNPFANQYPVLADSTTFPLPLYNTYSTMRLPPSHLPSLGPNAIGSIDGHASVASLGPLQVANRIPGDISVATSRAPSLLGVNDEPAEFGTPLQSMAGSRPRFLGLEGGGLRVPWTQTSGSFLRGKSFTKRRDGHGPGNWEHLPALPMPEDSNGRGATDAEGWTASLKTNLMNAFNAVAAGLPSAPTMDERQENHLTPCPTRHASQRRSLHPADQDETFVHRLTRESTISSKPWTLEERLDGTGTVHFHRLEGYRGGDHAFSPLPPGSSVTLQDGVQSDIGASIFRMTTHDSQTPLIVNRKPKMAVLRPRIYGRISQYGYGRKPVLVSRASSVYSTLSGPSSVYEYPSRKEHKPSHEFELSRSSTRTSGIFPSSERRRESGNFIGEARLTSSGCSLSSYRPSVAETMDKGVMDNRRDFGGSCQLVK